MMRKVLCLGFLLAIGFGVALAYELGEMIVDYGARNGTGVAIFSTDSAGIRAAVVYDDADGSGDYTEGDEVLVVRYFGVLRALPTEPLFGGISVPRLGVLP